MARRPSHLRLVTESPEPAITIDCAECVAQHTDACDDCIVSFLVDHDVDTPVEFDEQEQRAMEVLADAGLVPASRFSPRPGVA